MDLGKQMIRVFCLVLAFCIALMASGGDKAGALPTQNKENSRYFLAVTKMNYDQDRAKIGKRLFFDKRLSEDGKTSCESCHNLYWDFSGTIRHTENGALDPISVLSSGLNYIFFNDGRIRSIYDQVDRSITDINELATQPDRLVARLAKIQEYNALFARAYKDGLTYENVRDALVEFEKAITSVNSPFDRYLNGDTQALSSEQKKGLELFKEIGCVACHNGVNLGANVQQIVNFYDFIIKTDELSASGADLSGYDPKAYFFSDTPLRKENGEPDIFSCKHSVTGKAYKPKMDFMRIPPLRNIARSRPYFRCGKKLTLQRAIKDVSKIQLNYDISDEETELIYKFLLSLDGEIPRILK